MERDLSDPRPDFESRIARLTDGQRVCLMLVAEHRSSKEIGRHLGISPHTVDQRIRIALKLLGVRRRGEAARLIIHSAGTEQRSRAILPVATRHHSRNDMSRTVRLFWIAAIAAASALAVGMSLAALESISELLGRR